MVVHFHCIALQIRSDWMLLSTDTVYYIRDILLNCALDAQCTSIESVNVPTHCCCGVHVQYTSVNGIRVQGVRVLVVLCMC